MNNMIVRTALLRAEVKAWQLARDILRISESSLYRKMRSEIPEPEQRRIASLIDNYAEKGGKDHGKTAYYR